MQRILEIINRYLLYIVTGYVLVDYFLRLSGVSFMASLWDETLFILLVGTWILLAGIKGLKPRASTLLIPLLIFYAVITYIYLTKSPEPGVAFMELRALLQYTFWFFVGLNLINSRQQVKNICDIFMAVGLIVALYGIFQYVTGAEIPSTWVDKAEESLRTRAFSFIGSPNVLGSFLILHISMAFGSFMAAQHWFKKRVYLGITGTSMLCLIFTFSRGAWIVFFFAFLLLALWLDKRILIALVILALITPVAVPSVYNRVAYMLSPEYAASAAEGGRIARWSQAVDYWEADPATGLGLGRFGGGVAIANFPNSAYSVDNFYLKLATETGLMGLGAFLLLIFSALRLGRRSIEQVKDNYLKTLGTGIFVGLVAVLGHNMVENMFEFPLMATYFWFLLGLLAALPLIQDKTMEGNEHG
ncbi:MAG: O-antigen ligase family protein [Syntrophomonadaceae bacterium]|nr:O-antigen ligase family protein [Syntrophomonadaceae bacterium]MDD4548908.1 O-antigen ligase family protein [Syntrophomonadaceae bacterium]